MIKARSEVENIRCVRIKIRKAILIASWKRKTSVEQMLCFASGTRTLVLFTLT